MSTTPISKTGHTQNSDVAQECRTFLRWVNFKLSISDKKPITDIYDLCDGIILVDLIETLTGRKISNKFTKIKTKLHKHHFDRVTLVLECMNTEDVETFREIDPGEIVNGNVETILAIIWSLIWHYSIASKIFDSQKNNHPIDSYDTTKYRFLQWLQMKIPTLAITNLTTDWKDGKLIATLINSIAPGLCDPTTWIEKNRLLYLTETMTLARDWLNVQMYILPEEFVASHLNERVVMTYLSQFITATLRSGAPLRAKRFSNRISAYGPGIAPFGPVAQAPANFTVETIDAGKGSIGVNIRGPNGISEKADVRFNNDDKLSYSVSYIPKMAGDYKVFVTFLGKDIPNSPFDVYVSENVSNASKIQLLGPGLMLDGNFCGRNTYFDIIAEDTENGIPEVIILDPSGHKTSVPVKTRQVDNNRWRCEYLSHMIGLHSVNVFFGGIPVKGSPFGVKISPICDSRKIRVRRRGIQSRGIRNGDDAVFFVHTTSAGIGTPEVKIVGPGGINQNVDIKHVKEDIYECHYYPAKEGRYVIMVKFGQFEVPKAPFEVFVGPRSQSSIIAYGPGLKGGVAGLTAAFVVEMNGEAGALAFSVAGPSQVEIECHDNGDGSAFVKYLPTVPGEYAIHILCDNEDINCSPFITQIQPKTNLRPDLVDCYGPGIKPNGVILNCATDFKVDLSKAKKACYAQLEIHIRDTLGNQLQHKSITNDHDVCTYSYIPKSTLPHVIEVNYGGVAAAHSPYRVYVSAPPDVSKIGVYGDWFETKTKLGESSQFKVDATQLDIAELNVYLVHEESASKIPTTISIENGIHIVDSKVTKPGNYLTKIFYGGVPVPFNQTVYVPPITLNDIPVSSVTSQPQSDKVKVYGPALAQSNLRAGEATFFNIDVSEAGHGIVAVCIFNMNGVPVDNVFVVNKGGGLYTVNFIPPYEKSIVVSVKFAHQNIKSSPFLLSIITKDEENVASNSFDKNQMTRRSDISLTIESTTDDNDDSPDEIEQTSPPLRYAPICFKNLPVFCALHELTAQVKMPNGNIDLPIVEDNFDGTVRIQYNPKEDGVHEMILLKDGAPIQGSPYKFHVDSLSSGGLTAYGPGLTGGKVGEPCVFTISTKNASGPLLSLSVEGPSKAKISYTDNKDGTILVSFVPTEPGDYAISVRFGDKHIAGSPFNCKVEGDSKKRNQISIASCSQVTLPGVLTDADLRSLNALIMTPSGMEEPCFLKRLPSGNIGISFTPRETGDHVVHVKRMGQQIKNSPFKIVVTEKEVGNAKKVKTAGGALANGKTNTDNAFTIDTRNAGYGGLSLSIEGPSKVQIKCLDQEDGTLQISYRPTAPGNYVMNLKFADHHVEGSPFNIKVAGEESKRQRENMSQQTSAVPANDVGSKCKLTFKMPGITSFDLAASVTSPKSVTQDAEVQEVEDGLYAVHFVPKDQGVHIIAVKYTDIHIPGSPFQYTVGPFVDSGSHLVKAGGTGLEFGEVGVPAEFNIWTREAGEGKIAISIEGPSKAEITFKDRKDGSCNVAYVVKEPGQYNVGLKFNERHIPDSPYVVKFTPPATDAHKVEIAQFPQGNIQPNTPSQFLVRKNGAKGDIDAKIVSPTNPRVDGIHSIHVKLNGVHIPGSPYRVRVGKDVADASVVRAEGPGLRDAVSGQKTHFIITTLDAGSGNLSVTLDGPAKVSLDCTEIDDGYKARYTPFLAGEYFVSVRYNSTHVVGSPFRVNVTGKQFVDEGGQESTNVLVQTTAKHSKGNRNGPALPVFNADATKVTVKGMGIKKAFVGKQNQFSVNCSEAGHSILFVGLYNPKGPCEEVQVKHTGKNVFTVNYYIRERGEYTLLVMWGENHIPGSPFAVEVPTKC